MPLAIRVQFLAGYSGREWPPSPARLFKALAASARAGWAQTNRKAIDDSLRLLERQGWEEGTQLPEIVAPRAGLRAPRQRRFVPNNSKNWPAERKLNPEKGIDLEPEPMVGWDVEEPHSVWYWWPSVEASQVPVLREVARRVFSVGKGEDLAVLDASDVEPQTIGVRWQPAASYPHAPSDALWSKQTIGVRWQPAASVASMEVPEPGCLDVCDALFARHPSDPPLPVAGIRAVTYASDVAASAQAVPAFVLGLWRNGKRCSWDARLLRQVVGPIRHLLDEIRNDVVDLLARSTSERPEMETLVRRVLLGQDDSGNPITEPHLAVMPLPSILGPYPDGRIRRVALAGFGCDGDPIRQAIVELAQVLLYGRELRDNGRNTGVFLDAEPDNQWREAIIKRSQTWVTVTPIVQAAKELTASEWKRLVGARRDAEREPSKAAARELHLRERRLELIERSVDQAIAGQKARIESIEFARGGFIAGVHIATQYRVSDYLSETPRLHVRVTVDPPVAGPISIGRGRHVGFGVMWPTD
jgi:CRISPR-associated protein Csb2